MPHSYGYRARTRHLFSQKFRKHGPVHLSDYLTVYKVGDYVDIKANASIHKGMPHKFYHGKTGRVWNISPRAVGVEINKQVGNRYITKRIHVRIEHVKKSKCFDDFIARKKATQAAAIKAKADGVKFVRPKRNPGAPRPGEIVPVTAGTPVIALAPREYELLI